MKNLKKVLSLVLALAMALSLMTAAFAADAADYTDIDDVSYTEAVGVMTAVGVFQGNDGKFSPSATLDRASAAKLIAYLDLGAKQADALTATGTMFSDVSATHWAAGYIEYMAAAGYTNGVGNGKFNPSGTVTALEFGKWLLTVLGYDASVEKLTGDVWAINTSKLANSIGLFDGVDVKANAAMTREAAAVYCLNALQATCVKYSTTGTSIIIGDTTVNTGASTADPVNVHANKGLYAAGDGYLQLTEKLYGAKLQKTAGTADAFGRPATRWDYDGKTVGTYTVATAASYQNVVKHNALYNLFGKTVADSTIHYSVIGNTDASKYYTTVTVNGVNIADTNANYYKFENKTNDLVFTSKGATTEVFKDTDAKTINIVVTETFVGKASADYNANTKKLSVVNVTGKTFLDQKTDTNKDGFEVKDYKKGDFFLYTYANGVQSITPAKTMSGVVSSYIAGKSVTVDGTEYFYSKNFYTVDGNSTNVAYKLGETATFVMDGMGNIIAISELTAAADDQYVYAENIDKVDGRNPVIMANIVNIDGTAKDDVTVKSVNGEGTVDIVDAYSTYTATGWYKYTMDGEKYKLVNDGVKAYYTVASSAYELTKTGRVTVGKTDNTNGYYTAKANSATVFIVKDADDKIVTYTGIANVPTITATTATYAYYLNGDNGFAKYVYIDLGSTASTSAATTTSSDVFYILNKSGLKVVAGATSTADPIKYYTLDVLKDGKVQNIDVLQNAGLDDKIGYLYTNAKADSNNRVTTGTMVNSNTVVDTFGVTDTQTDYYVSYSNNVLSLSSTPSGAAEINVAVTDDAVVYLVLNPTNGNKLMEDTNNTYEVLTVTPEQLAGMMSGYHADITYSTFYSAKDSGVVKTLYVTLSNVVE